MPISAIEMHAGKNLVNGIMIFADCFLSKMRRNNLQIHDKYFANGCFKGKKMGAEGRFSVRCAENCGNDRLHRREVNVYMPYIRQLAVTKTVVMAMKTVVMEIRCRMP